MRGVASSQRIRRLVELVKFWLWKLETTSTSRRIGTIKLVRILKLNQILVPPSVSSPNPASPFLLPLTMRRLSRVVDTKSDWLVPRGGL